MFTSLLLIFGSILTVVGIGAFILIQSGDLIMFVFVVGVSLIVIVFLNLLYFRNRPEIAHKIQSVCKTLFLIGIINFLACCIIGLFIGGVAVDGIDATGRYFLSNHGKYTEVSYIVYMYSKIHADSLFISHPLAMVSALVHLMTGGDFRNLRP